MITGVSGNRQPLQNIAWLVGERVVRAVVTATVLAMVARHLQPEGFGRLNFALAVTAICAALANLGLEGVVVNELVNRPSQGGAVLGTACRLRLLAGLLTCGLLSAVFWSVPQLQTEALLVGVISLGMLLQPVEVLDLWFQRHLDSRRTVVARFMGVAAGATLKLWLVARGAGLPAFAWAQLADVVFIAVSLAWVGSRSPYRSGPWTWDVEIARVLWRRGAPLALSGMVVALALRLDQLLVRTWLGDGQAGIYFAATRLTDMAIFVGVAISVSLFPALSASHARSVQEYQIRLHSLFAVLSALGWLVVLGCNLAGPWIIRLLYGASYAEAVPVLALQSWACLIALNATARWNFIILSAPTLVNLGAAFLHILCLLGLAGELMPRWGAPGAAFALVVANFVSGILTTALFPSLRSCASAQMRGLLIVFTPGRWPGLLREFRP